MEFLDLHAAKGVRGEVRLPGSKSISNRVLLLAALASGETHVRDLLTADDTLCMLNALKALGVSISQTDENDYSVKGVGGRFPVRKADLFLGNAGTAYRPLTAVLSLMQGNYRLYGVPRMYERPIKDLVDALRQLGSDITYLGNDGFPPIAIKNSETWSDALVIRGEVSSQYLTSLLIASPLINKMLSIEVVGKIISQPYINLTLALMLRFGVEIEQEGLRHFVLHDGLKYESPGEIFVEGDASSASYFLAAGVIGGGPVRIEGVGRNSLQGDILFIKALEKMGAGVRQGDNWIEAQAPQSGSLRAINIDCNHIPDAAMTLAVVALFADGVTTLTNIASWRVKETDRISAMAIELRKLGATVDEGLDFLKITPSINKKITPHVHINTYDDHRMAMCFSLVSIGVPVRINNPACVSKTFPNYFEKFAEIAIY
ncbi:MAG: 3-phosphoshikimate 1-carboxyvinyltransferase [Nitrosomonadaceae bacterium]|nr:3-phosphoshikimate 1-carboxyvinyltransferase [Nitrosomonadaceae bacterium]